MNSKGTKCARRGGKGFTIIELLTVLSIIILLIGILVPALNKTRQFAKKVVQRGQFHEISKALELFRNDHRDTYPDSGAADTDGPYGYCGAMKLCEALIGQDGMGFHPSSRFYASGFVSSPPLAPYDAYPFDLCTPTNPADYDEPTVPAEKFLIDNLRLRIKYLDSENIKAVRLKDLYSATHISSGGVSFYDGVTFQTTTDVYPFAFPNPVITDVFQQTTSLCSGDGSKLGMPVLYYTADPSKLVHDANTPPAVATPNPNIYNFDDNYAITTMGCPWDTAPSSGGPTQPMDDDPLVFYDEITNTRITSTPRPHNADGYILMSAGWDGLYGTRDDVFNFAD